MNREEALAFLRASVPNTRTEAARTLEQIGSLSDVDELRAAYEAEKDPYVQTALAEAMAWIRTRSAGAGSTTRLPKADEVLDPLMIAFAQVSRVIAHEVRRGIDVVSIALTGEAPHADSTQSALAELRETLDRLVQLGQAVDLLDYSAVNLGEFVASRLGEIGEVDPEIIVATDDQIECLADARLLQFAFSNGLRNAIQACEGVTSPRIVISYGVSNDAGWIRVSDSGRGLTQEQAAEANRFAYSTKNSAGVGLTVANTAMSRMDGYADVQPEPTGGALFTMEWSTRLQGE